MTATAPERPCAVLLGVQLEGVPDGEFESSLAELSRLAKTLGLEIVGRVVQKRRNLGAPALVGAGKLEELARLTGGSGVVPVGPPGRRRQAGADEEEEPEEIGIDAADAEQIEEDRQEGAEVAPVRLAGIVLIDHDISPTQTRNLERATDAEVLDRSAVILAIFQRHARSRAARLQVEIARLSYIAPRLRETGGGRDRQGGGLAARGAGESASELDRRKVRDRIAALRQELEGIERESASRRKRRERQQTAALVGYTNAGKSSAMRALTDSGVHVENKLFATLDTTVRALQPEMTPRVLVSDTVGFIKNLPHDLVASFQSTLDEARDADLLLHLADASDPAFAGQIEVTLRVLRDIGAAEVPRLLVLNKVDRLSPERREELASQWPDALQVSVKESKGVALLRDRIVAHFERDMIDAELIVPYAKQRVVSETYTACRVLSERHDEHGTHLLVRAPGDVIQRLRESL